MCVYIYIYVYISIHVYIYIYIYAYKLLSLLLLLLLLYQISVSCASNVIHFPCESRTKAEALNSRTTQHGQCLAVSNSAPAWSSRCRFTACRFQFGRSLRPLRRGVSDAPKCVSSCRDVRLAEKLRRFISTLR